MNKSPVNLEETSVSLWRRPWAVLFLILFVGAALRLVDLTGAPPGLNQDEASNAWNAYCMLKTGKDQNGVRWPIFYTRAFGENRSTLFLYWMLPFQALGGLNVLTTRLPSAVGGILTLWLIYYIGKRLFDRKVGLAAAGLMAINPWHIQQCRWGHEAAIVPLVVCATFAAMLWANLPIIEDEQRRPRPVIAFIAGMLSGISCYGYPAIRIFLPLFVLAVVMVTWRLWWRALWKKPDNLAIAAAVVGGLLTFGPLAWKHYADSRNINRRLDTTRVWKDTDSTGTKLLRVLERYPGHFGPRFLFLKGDSFAIQAPPGSGQFQLYMLPLMLVGLGWVVCRSWSSPAARILLVWILLYPAGDMLSHHMGLSPHALRSLPGLGGLVLLAAVGLVSAATWIYARRPMIAKGLGFGLVLTVFCFQVNFLYRFFWEFGRRPFIYHNFQADLLEACDWLKPRLDDVDAVFCTTSGTNQPHIILLVGLGYDPHEWFRQKLDVGVGGEWDVYRCIGKLFFVYSTIDPAALESIRKRKSNPRVVLITRPDELSQLPSTRQIVRPDGNITLRIVDRRF